MTSYRTQLTKINIPANTLISYKTDFYSRPHSLKQAMQAMDMPETIEFVTEIKDIDTYWTEECQGVLWDGSHWVFSSNGSQPPSLASSPLALYSFKPGKVLKEDYPDDTFIIGEVSPLSAVNRILPQIPMPPDEPFYGFLHHIGPMAYYNGYIYVDHWTSLEPAHGQVLVLQRINGKLSFVKWIQLKHPITRIGMVGINPWDGNFYTCVGGEKIDFLFIYTPDGEYIDDMPLNPPIDDGCYVQGGFFSPNGHIYITSGRRDDKKPKNSPHKGAKAQYIYCYSALNGSLLRKIPVTALEEEQELEGICYAPTTLKDGRAAQIRVVLLDNYWHEKDNIFLKWYGASEPHLL